LKACVKVVVSECAMQLATEFGVEGDGTYYYYTYLYAYVYMYSSSMS